MGIAIPLKKFNLQLEKILEPIEGDNPAGRSVRFTSAHSNLSKLRKESISPKLDEEKGEPIADWRGDWPPIARKARDFLIKDTKDLEIAVWLTEALTREEGFAGLYNGLKMLRELHERFWDHLYPELDGDDDAEARAGAFGALEHDRFPPVILSIPVTDTIAKKGPYSYYDWKKAKDSSSVVRAQPGRRSSTGGSGIVTSEAFAAVAKGTSPEFYRALGLAIDGCLVELDRLNEFMNAHYGDEGISFSKLKKAIEQCKSLVDRWRPPEQPKTTGGGNGGGGDQDKDAENKEVGSEGGGSGEPTGGGGTDKVGGRPPQAGGLQKTSGDIARNRGEAPIPLAPIGRAVEPEAALGVMPGSPNEVPDLVRQLAGFARRHDPADPMAYQVSRALRWGELRRHADPLEPEYLPAPDRETRLELRMLLAAERWPVLLERSEAAVARPEGRAWLDPQFYSFTACVHLGEQYTSAAALIADGTRHLLEDVEGLLDAELSDGTPCASGLTRKWVLGELAPRLPSSGDRPPPRRRRVGAPAPSEWEAAQDYLAQGLFSEGVRLLRDALGEARSGRMRFIRQLEIAELCLMEGKVDLAVPILADLQGQAEQRKLDEWEEYDLVARLWSAVYASRTGGKQNPADQVAKKVFEQLCRIDVNRALAHLQDRET